jgi:upstream activation factor subunit UAF30
MTRLGEQMPHRTIKTPTKVGSISLARARETAQISAEESGSARIVKGRPNAAFMKAMTPSATLAAVVGSMPLPRTEVTKKIWDYIKKNKLQDSVNARLINSDEKLRKVFGGKKRVSMFEMTKLVSNHLK